MDNIGQNLAVFFKKFAFHRRFMGCREKNIFIWRKFFRQNSVFCWKAGDLLLLFLFLALGIFYATEARAGFGISPPYLKSDRLVPGSHYEQVITLLRSSADEDLRAEIQIVAPEIESWITVVNGNDFILPKDKLQVPMTITVDVPGSAELGKYGGHINVRIAPKEKRGQGAVSIALGARIEIDFTVTNKFFPDFLVREANIQDFSVPGWPWRWPIFARFFYRIKYAMTIENTGNVAVAPSRVHIDVYDMAEKKLLESHDDKSFKKVAPYKTDRIVASFPTRLGAGQYWSKIKIYKDEKVVRSDKDAFTIYPYGKFPGNVKLGIWPWLLLGGYTLFLVIVITALIKVKIWRYLFWIFRLLIWPFRFAARRLSVLWRSCRLKFWRWMHKKAEKYQNNNKEESRQNSSGVDAGHSVSIDLRERKDNDR